MAKGASIDGSGSCNTHGGLESKGGLAGEAKRLERAAKKLERANEDLASDDVSRDPSAQHCHTRTGGTSVYLVKPCDGPNVTPAGILSL